MRYLLLMVLATVLVCGGCSTSLSVVLDGGTSDTDTDTDTDADTDSDTETETEEEGCGSPTGITNWGGPCHTNADCPPNTTCRISSFQDSSEGFCAVECCNYWTADVDYCTDVAAGQEGCYMFLTDNDTLDWPPPYLCVIFCNTPADCPLGTDCVESGGGGSWFCYGYAPATDAGVDGGP